MEGDNIVTESTKELPTVAVQWSIIPAGGSPPIERDYHNSGIIANKMFIIGGTSVGASKALEDCIHHFNFTTSRWDKDLVHNTDTIKYQHAHAVNVWNDKIVITGGKYAQVWLYDPSTAQIEEIAVLPGKVKIAAVIVGDDLYALHNSIDDNDHQFDELTILNLVTKQQIQIQTSGDVPKNQTMEHLIYSEDNIYLYGGYSRGMYYNHLYALNIRSYEWKKIEFPEDNRPSSCAGHSFTLVKTGNGELFGVLFGGYSGTSFLHTVALYDFARNIWRKVDTLGSVTIEARSVHSAVADGDTVYIWSGNVGGTEIYALKVYGTDLSLKTIVAKYIARNLPNENINSLPQELVDLIRSWRI
jgi:hypothetical protein